MQKSPGAETDEYGEEDAASVKWLDSSLEEEEEALILFWLSFKLQTMKMEMKSGSAST